MVRARPDDDFMHPNTGESNFNESMYFNVYDRNQRFGGFFRLGNRPNEKQAEMTIALYLPDGTAMFNYKRPEIADNSRFDAGGMRFEVVRPHEELRVTYEGSAVFLARPLDLEDPRAAFTSNPFKPVSVDLTYTGLSPMYGGEADPSIDSAELVFARGHTEQHVRARGRIVVDGEEMEIDGFGLRDHSWGPRSWQSPSFYRWLTCEFDDGFGFMGSLIVTQSGAELKSGFVFRNGENHLVRSLEVETRRVDPGNYHDRIRATLRTDAGDFFVTGKVLSMLPLRNRREGRTTRISEGLTLWRHGKHVGYGWSEYLDQVE